MKILLCMLMLLINSTCFSQKVKKEDEIEISKSGVVELKKCVNSKIDKDQYKVLLLTFMC